MYKILLMVLSLCSSAIFSNDKYSNQEVGDDQMVEFYTLPKSRSTLNLPINQYKVYAGDNAQRFWKSLTGEVNNDLEAIIIKNEREIIRFEYHNTGYMPLTGWDKMNMDNILEKTYEYVEADNHAKRLQGLPEVHILKWLYKPFFL